MALYAEFHFEDFKGKKAVTRISYGPSADIGAMLTSAVSIAPLLQAVSSARLFLVALVSKEAVSPLAAIGPDADCERSGLLLYNNGTRTAGLAVPSIKLMLAEASGPYAGRRITRDSLRLRGMLEAVDTLPGNALDASGRAIDGPFSLGCISGRLPL